MPKKSSSRPAVKKPAKASAKPTAPELWVKIPHYPMGEIPESIEGMALRRALAKRALINSYEVAEDDPADAIRDLLADLRHLCDALGLDFAAADRMAYQHYLEEKSEASDA